MLPLPCLDAFCADGRKRKVWPAAEMGVECCGSFVVMFGAHWWFHLGPALLDVILPVEYYQVLRDGALVWDDLGRKAYSSYIAKFPGDFIEDAMTHLRYRLFWELGKRIYRNDSGQVRDFVLDMIAKRPEITPATDPQLSFKFTTEPGEEG